jgi:FIMAH domain-containing protein
MRRSLLRPALALAALASLCLAALPAPAQTVDQQQTDGGGFGSSILYAGPLGQEFTPTLDALNFVDLLIADAELDGAGATISVNIREDSITGTLLGSSLPVSLPDGFGVSEISPGAEVRFVFATPVALTPGNRYVIEITQSAGGNFFARGSYPDPYSGGRAIFQGLPAALDDFFFREGLLDPDLEPADLIGDLIDLVESYPLPKGIKNSFVVKLEAALAALEAEDDASACDSLQAFINHAEAQRGKKLTEAQALALIGAAQAIREALGCS